MAFHRPTLGCSTRLSSKHATWPRSQFEEQGKCSYGDTSGRLTCPTWRAKLLENPTQGGRLFRWLLRKKSKHASLTALLSRSAAHHRSFVRIFKRRALICPRTRTA